MGYDWKGWAVIFYVFGAAYMALGIGGPTYWGVTEVQYHWLLFVMGIAAGVGAKFGSSWVGKTGETIPPGNDLVKQGTARYLLPFVLSGSLLFSGCAAKQYPTLPPESQKQVDATEMAKRVNRLMDVAIEAEAMTPKALGTAQTRVIVRFCVEADKTLAQYPNGWGPLLATAWKELKADPLIEPLIFSNQYISTAATLVDLALAIWTPKAPEAACLLCYS